MDAEGNILYSAGQTRLRKTDGSLKNMEDAPSFWCGLDGILYYCYGSTSTIKKVVIDTDVNIEEYGTSINASVFDYTKLTMKDKILVVDGSVIYEIYNEEGKPGQVSFEDLKVKYFKSWAATENYYFLSGHDENENSFLIKVDPSEESFEETSPIRITPKWTKVIDDNNYDILSFTASETDGIIFNALRMSDGKKIVAKVGIDGGNVTVLDEESDAEIKYLCKLN